MQGTDSLFACTLATVVSQLEAVAARACISPGYCFQKGTKPFTVSKQQHWYIGVFLFEGIFHMLQRAKLV